MVLWDSTKLELKTFMGLIPLIGDTLGQDNDASIVSTDASEWGYGAVSKGNLDRCFRVVPIVGGSLGTRRS